MPLMCMHADRIGYRSNILLNSIEWGPKDWTVAASKPWQPCDLTVYMRDCQAPEKTFNSAEETKWRDAQRLSERWHAVMVQHQILYMGFILHVSCATNMMTAQSRMWIWSKPKSVSVVEETNTLCYTVHISVFWGCQSLAQLALTCHVCCSYCTCVC